MTDQELEALLNDLETDRVERKESISDGDKIRQAICAFANDLPNHRLPGVLFIGVDDDGKCVNLRITDQLLLTLSNMRGDGSILPFPSLTVQKRTLNGGEMAVVIVEPADAPPVRFKGVVWVRVGPRRAWASPQDERILSEKRRAFEFHFDIRQIPYAGLDVLDEVMFRNVYLPSAVDAEVLAENGRPLEQQYASLRFAHPGTPGHPTVLGMLVVGKNPTDVLPGAYVQFLRLDGKELTDPIKLAKELRGPLCTLIRNLDDLLDINIATAVDFTSQNTEIRTSDYPLAALKQIARNAIMHRVYESTNAPVRIYWFSDRVEIISPGGPYGFVNRSNFGQPGLTDYRNPNLAEAMKNLGYVQRFGAGLVTARREMEKNGNPPIEFKVEDNFVTVVLSAHSEESVKRAKAP